MGGVVDAGEAFGPADVCFCRVVAILATPAGLPPLIEEFGPLVWGMGHGSRQLAATRRMAGS